jgi:signal transduction histidine kinase
MTECASIILRIDQTLAAVRRIATALRPSVLDQLGLAAALEWQGQEFGARTGIEVEMELCVDGSPIPEALGSSVFRILQESLTNIARYAGATHVTIRLEQTPSLLTLDVSDDGVGFDPARLETRGSLGLLGMRERALACGGTFAISSEPGHGTTVSLRVPRAAATAEAPR